MKKPSISNPTQCVFTIRLTVITLQCSVLAMICSTINNSYPHPLLAHAVHCQLRNCIAHVATGSIMPPKAKKPKVVAGQKTLSFAQGFEPSTALPTISPLSTVPHEPSASIRGWDVLGTPSSRRGAVVTWRAFAAAKWCNKHP